MLKDFTLVFTSISNRWDIEVLHNLKKLLLNIISVTVFIPTHLISPLPIPLLRRQRITVLNLKFSHLRFSLLFPLLSLTRVMMSSKGMYYPARKRKQDKVYTNPNCLFLRTISIRRRFAAPLKTI